MHLGVVPEHAARQPVALDPGRHLETSVARQGLAGGQMLLAVRELVAIPTQEIVDEQSRAHHCSALEKAPSISRDKKRQRVYEVRRNAHEVSALAHRFAHSDEIGVLQIAEAAMDGLEIVERSTAPEITFVDERDG